MGKNGRGVHATDRWKQDASWKKLGQVKLGDFFHVTNQQNSYLQCTQTTKNVALGCVLRAQNAFAGLRPGPRWRAAALPQLLTIFLGERIGKGKEREKKGEGRGKERDGRKGSVVGATWGRLLSGADGDGRPEKTVKLL